MENTHTNSHEVTTGFYIASFLILALILGVFGDLFTFILGFIGLVVVYAAFLSGDDSADDHH